MQTDLQIVIMRHSENSYLCKFCCRCSVYSLCYTSSGNCPAHCCTAVGNCGFQYHIRQCLKIHSFTQMIGVFVLSQKKCQNVSHSRDSYLYKFCGRCSAHSLCYTNSCMFPADCCTVVDNCGFQYCIRQCLKLYSSTHG